MPNFVIEWVLGSADSYLEKHLVELDGALYLPFDFIEGFIIEFIPFVGRHVAFFFCASVICGLVVCCLWSTMAWVSKLLDELLERRKKRKSTASAVDK